MNKISNLFNAGYGLGRAYPQKIKQIKELVIEEDLYEWIDLGLPSGTLWAAWNVGALAPEEYGLYFAWGETQGYTGTTDEKGFYWGDYKFSIDDSNSNFSKYNSTDGLTTLESLDDTASATQSTCRMPTKADFEELKANTTSAWTSVNGVSGMQLTSKVEGYTDKSIFVPAAGFYYSESLKNTGSNGYYWSSSLHESDKRSAQFLGFNSGNVFVHYNDRCIGKSVRAVKSK